MFLGRSVTQHKQVSDETAHAIDEEVRRVIDDNYSARADILDDQPRQAARDGRGADQVRDHRRRSRSSDIMAGREPRPPDGLGRRATPPSAGARPPRAAATARRPSGRARAAALTAVAAPGPAGRCRLRPDSDAARLRATACSTSTEPRGHGRAQRHARFLLRRRSLRSTSTRPSRAALAHGRGGRRHHRRRRRVDPARVRRRSPVRGGTASG